MTLVTCRRGVTCCIDDVIGVKPLLGLSFLAVSRQIIKSITCFGFMVWLVNGLKEGFRRQEQGRYQEADVLIGV